jgi:hypothetical protein
MIESKSFVILNIRHHLSSSFSHGTSSITKKSNTKPTVTSLISNGRRRLVYVYENGREMIEEYDTKTHEIVTRKIKNPTNFKEAKW